jgi:hypothetical protein
MRNEISWRRGETSPHEAHSHFRREEARTVVYWTDTGCDSVGLWYNRQSSRLAMAKCITLRR